MVFQLANHWFTRSGSRQRRNVLMGEKETDDSKPHPPHFPHLSSDIYLVHGMWMDFRRFEQPGGNICTVLSIMFMIPTISRMSISRMSRRSEISMTHIWVKYHRSPSFNQCKHGDDAPNPKHARSPRSVRSKWLHYNLPRQWVHPVLLVKSTIMKQYLPLLTTIHHY